MSVLNVCKLSSFNPLASAGTKKRTVRTFAHAGLRDRIDA
jgi:hypothetical protein